MATRTSRPSKLSTPRLARVVPRARLFRRLDGARRRRVVWITAQPGAGKTALASSWVRARRLPHAWLTLDRGDGDVPAFFHWLAQAAGGGAARRRLPRFSPEYLAAPGAYARRFLRAWFAGARAHSVLVLDDYQELAAGSPLHEALRDGLCEVPPGGAVVVLSRAAPPPALAGLEAVGSLERIRGEELSVRPAEAQRIAALWGCTGRDRAAVAALQARAEGWAVGLVLLLAARGGLGGEGSGADPRLLDYVAQEVLGRAEPAVRRVLLETSLLPAVTGPMAAAITGDPRAGEVLADLSRRGFFVARHQQGYRFHALVREYLHGRAPAELGEARWSEVRRTAARLLEEAGQPEEAVHLLVQEAAWEDARRLIRAEAPPALERGRAEAVARWIGALPVAERERDPWLVLLLGQALQFLDPRGAAGHLRRAYDRLLEAGDGAGACTAWAALCETLCWVLQAFLEAEPWLADLEILRARFPDLGGPAAEPRLVSAAYGALAVLRPRDPVLAYWDERALALALGPGEPRWRLKLGQALLQRHGAWVVDLAEAGLVAEAQRSAAAAPEADPFTAIHWFAGEAFLHYHAGRPEACRQAVERGLARAREAGLHQWDLYLEEARSAAALLLSDPAEATRALEGMEATWDRSSFIASAVFQATALHVARDRGDLDRARGHARACRELIAAFRDNPSRHVFGLLCLTVDPPERVEPEVAALLGEARAAGNRFAEAGCLLALAAAAAARGEEPLALERLRAGLGLKRVLGCLGFPWLRPADLSDLLALAMEHGVEPEHAAAMVRAWRLPPGERALALEAWPRPLRVEALGGFTVLRDGVPLRSGRKEQRRPLELLRALVVAGPQGARQERLEEELWPEAEGDAAHHALGTAIYRLRRLLGEAGAVVHQGGRVGLEPREVFVDAWALERLLSRLDALRARRGDGAQEATLRRRATALWRGDLFGGDGGVYRGARERLAAHRARSLAVPVRERSGSPALPDPESL